MSNAPLMPKATAVWLVDNTALTFDQVADFTKLSDSYSHRFFRERCRTRRRTAALSGRWSNLATTCGAVVP